MLVAWPRWPWQWNQWQTTVAAAWDFFFQLSDVGKGRLDSKKTCVCLIYCVVVFFVILRLCQGDGSFTKSLGTNIFLATCKTVAGLYFFCRERGRTASVDCMACGKKIDRSQSRSGHQWITKDVCNFHCKWCHRTMIMILFEPSWVRWRKDNASQSIRPSIMLSRLWYFVFLFLCGHRLSSGPISTADGAALRWY